MGEVKNFPFFLDNKSVMKRYISNLTHTLAKGGLIALFGAALICCKSGNCNKPQNNKIALFDDNFLRYLLNFAQKCVKIKEKGGYPYEKEIKTIYFDFCSVYDFMLLAAECSCRFFCGSRGGV